MQKALAFKAFIVGLLMLVIGIPLSMIQSTIRERSSFHDEAVQSVANDSARAQTLAGPVLVLPYSEEWREGDAKDLRVKQGQLLVFPEELQIGGKVDVEKRHRGIHEVLVYSGRYNLSGDFTLPSRALTERQSPRSILTWRQPYVAMAIEDVRGVRNLPKLEFGSGGAVEFAQGSGLNGLPNGLHANLNEAAVADGAKLTFKIALDLDGTERQAFVPLGKNNTVRLSSSWPHPQFGGRFLPSARERTSSADGFSAVWHVSSLATSAQHTLRTMPSDGKANLDSFHVAFIDPVNIYSQADRAAKYGLMFVALTFAFFFTFEILKRLPIHPVQYGLVGLALVMFFLLLVSLSEHIAFVRAYAIASGACIVLIGYYLAHVLRDWRRGLGFATLLTLLYGALYGLLSSENNSLVLGSTLIFAILAVIMIVTRKVDWYNLNLAKP